MNYGATSNKSAGLSNDGYPSILGAWEMSVQQFAPEPLRTSPAPTYTESEIDPCSVGLNSLTGLHPQRLSPKTLLLNTGFLHRYNFWPSLPRPASPEDVFRDLDPSPTVSCTRSEGLADTAAIDKINKLESELDELRKMIAGLVRAQENNQIKSPLATPVPDLVNTPTIAPPAPPPPPPLPPPPSKTQYTPKSRRQSTSVPNTIESKKKSVLPNATFSVSAKDLSAVRLKKTKKSPGGTPLRDKSLNMDPTDPAQYLASVLKSRFSALQGTSPSPSARQSCSPQDFSIENYENRYDPNRTPVGNIRNTRIPKIFEEFNA